MEKRQRMMLLGVAAAVALVVVVIAIASSGGDDDKKDSSTSTSATGPAPDAPVTDKTAQEPAPPAPEQIDIKGGEPDGVKKISVNKNDPLEIEVSSDQKLPIHFHGYDIEKDAAPGKPAVFKLKKAKIDGVFEMEIESTGTKIASITVKP